MSFISRSRYLSAVVISRRIVLGLGVATSETRCSMANRMIA